MEEAKPETKPEAEAKEPLPLTKDDLIALFEKGKLPKEIIKDYKPRLTYSVASVYKYYNEWRRGRERGAIEKEGLKIKPKEVPEAKKPIEGLEAEEEEAFEIEPFTKEECAKMVRSLYNPIFKAFKLSELDDDQVYLLSESHLLFLNKYRLAFAKYFVELFMVASIALVIISKIGEARAKKEEEKEKKGEKEKEGAKKPELGGAWKF
jgi:hypothetical protein